ncbi:MAG: hypothetical protein WCO89_12145, partial [Syntrophus sp. (in: bacteria)]
MHFHGQAALHSRVKINRLVCREDDDASGFLDLNKERSGHLGVIFEEVVRLIEKDNTAVKGGFPKDTF